MIKKQTALTNNYYIKSIQLFYSLTKAIYPLKIEVTN